MNLELPLFPLNTVLFPQAPIHLHIFEERYLEMIGACIERHLPFGVVLIRRGAEALGPLAEPHQVGCSAGITQVQPLQDGRLNIIAAGQERFKILSLNKEEHLYLVGTVEMLPLPASDKNEITRLSQRLRPWLERYLDILSHSGVVTVKRVPIPEDPITLAYMACSVIQAPPIQKQVLLSSENALVLLTELLAMYRRETALLKATLGKKAVEVKGGFSAN